MSELARSVLFTPAGGAEMKTARTVVTIVTALLMSGAAGVAYDEESEVYGAAEYRGPAYEENEEYGDAYRSGEYGRIRYLESGATIIRGFSSDYSPAEVEGNVNSPIYPEDTLRTASRERVEIQLARGSVVRLDEGSELTFQALPDPYAEFQDNTVLGLHQGAVRIHALVEENEEFRIDTPAGSIYLLNDADVRVEIGSDGRTVVSTYRGVTELAADGGSVLVRGGMTATAYSGTYPDEPRPFNTMSGDRFDRWVEDREATYLATDRYLDEDERREVYAELPSEVRPYYGELSSHGRWVHVNDYGWCWYPAAVRSGWRPYVEGYWHYGPSGYFWVSNEPWGWAPYHYGRWDWVAGIGWCWIPGRVFGGAWVSWSWGPTYVGWAPLGYYNRVAVVGDVYYEHYASHSWTFVSYTHIRHRHGYHRYAVPVHRIGRDHGHRIVTRPPRVSPRDLARDRDARWRARDEAGRRRVVDRGRNRGPRFTDIEDRSVRERRVKKPRRVAERPPDDRRGAPRGRAPKSDPRVMSRKRTDRTGSVGQRPRPRQVGPTDDANRRVRDLYDRAARPPSARRNPEQKRTASGRPSSDRGSPRRDQVDRDRGRNRPTTGAAPRQGRTPTRTAPPSSRRNTEGRRTNPSTPPSSRRNTGSRRTNPSTPPKARSSNGSRTPTRQSASRPTRRSAPKSSASRSSSGNRSGSRSSARRSSGKGGSRKKSSDGKSGRSGRRR
jgi:hypothetical protein